MKSSHKAKKKPSYDQSLCAYQVAFKVEFARIIERLPLTKELRILDTPCGNGFYSRMLADRRGPNGKIDCVDLNAEYLAATRRRLHNANCRRNLHEADAYELPFADGTFDLVWCAQSLISLDDALSTVQEMKRVLRPGGILAVLENDIFHHVCCRGLSIWKCRYKRRFRSLRGRDMDRARSLLPSGAYPRYSLMRAFILAPSKRSPQIGKSRGRPASDVFWNFTSKTFACCFADTCLLYEARKRGRTRW